MTATTLEPPAPPAAQTRHGDFTWYELITADPDGAEAFYGPLLGWSFARSDQPQDYRIFSTGEGQVGGVMKTPDGAAMPPVWLGYVQVDDLAAMLASFEEAGGALHFGPHEVPGIGPIALVADPQGASFYLIEDRTGEGSLAFSYDRPRPGHCAWNELATTDVEAAKQFYGQRFGWVKDGEMDMGALGKYQFLRHAGRAPEGSPMGRGMLGAVMPKLPQMPAPAWTHYFRVPDIGAALAHIEAEGGTVTQPPIEIPGGDFSMNAIDPQGAHFGLVGAPSLKGEAR